MGSELADFVNRLLEGNSALEGNKAEESGDCCGDDARNIYRSGEEFKMKNSSKILAIVLGAVSLSLGSNIAVSAERDDGAGGIAAQAAPEVVGGAPTLRVGYMYSTTGTPRRAMAISITNNSAQPCDTTVRWRAGGNQLIGTSSIVIPPGQTLEHCSRSISSATVICNATSSPEVAPPQFIEGKADVHLASACRTAANVDAKQYYMTGSDDAGVAAVYRPATIRGVNYKGD